LQIGISKGRNLNGLYQVHIIIATPIAVILRIGSISHITSKKNHQSMLDTLKNFDIIPENSQIQDYEFLFSFEDKKEKEV
jgi:hypothetical protein